jgi:hypothetical protein
MSTPINPSDGAIRPSRHGCHARFLRLESFATLAALFSVVSVVSLTTGVSRAAPVTTLGAHGPIANRIAMVYIGDGFDSSATDQNLFATTVQRAIAYRDTGRVNEPYRRYRNFFNNYRIDLVSPESGIDEPEATPPIVRNTPLDGNGRNSTRLGQVSNSKTCAEVSTSLEPLGFGPTCSQISNMSYRTTTKVWIYVALNSTGYYNSGGPLCVFSRNYWGEIALHEAGHSHHQLADEYDGTNALPAGEPSEINVTKDPTGALKWGQWLGYNQTGIGLIGAFEGARYVSTGMYRPDNNSKMNLTSQNNPRRFNIVSMEKIVLDIYNRVRPLDAFRDTAGVLLDPESLWVKTVDPAVVWVDWYIDSARVRINAGERFALPDSLPAGTYTVRAHAYDEIVIRSGSNNASPHTLDWVRRDLHKLRQDVAWRVTVTPGAVALRPASPAPRTLRFSPVTRADGYVFDLPREGGYRIHVFTHDGKTVDVVTGTGRRGRNVVDPDRTRRWPRALLLLKVEPLAP